MKTATAFLAVWCLASCASVRPDCPVETLGVPAGFEHVNHGAELPQSARNMLRALAACDRDDCFLQAGLDLPSSPDTSRIRARTCLRVVRWTQETPSMVAFELSPVQSRDQGGRAEFIVYANYVDDRWRFSWPATLGPAFQQQ